MNISNTDNTAILIIDIQEKLLNAVFNKEIVQKKSEILAKTAQILEIPVIITEQYPQGLGQTVDCIKSNLSNEVKTFEKTSFNAMCDENLCDELKKINVENVVVIGIETHICVHQTVNDLLKKGYSVTIAKDCCGSRQESEYLSALNVMQNNGAQIKTTEMILFEFLKSARHSKFKEIQMLIK